MTFIAPEDASEEAAGFESYRYQLYASRAAVALGLKLLPTLASGDLYAEGPDVERLRAEAEVALANVELFEGEAGESADHLRARFRNILAAVRRASSMNGGVVIW